VKSSVKLAMGRFNLNKPLSRSVAVSANLSVNRRSRPTLRNLRVNGQNQPHGQKLLSLYIQTGARAIAAMHFTRASATGQVVSRSG